MQWSALGLKQGPAAARIHREGQGRHGAITLPGLCMRAKDCGGLVWAKIQIFCPSPPFSLPWREKGEKGRRWAVVTLCVGTTDTALGPETPHALLQSSLMVLRAQGRILVQPWLYLLWQIQLSISGLQMRWSYELEKAERILWNIEEKRRIVSEGFFSSVFRAWTNLWTLFLPLFFCTKS